jgi:hypothetical protein
LEGNKMDKSKQDEFEDRWLDDWRNSTYSNLRGSVFRGFPLDKDTLTLTNIMTGEAVTVSNLELKLALKDGKLTEIDFTSGRMITLPAGVAVRNYSPIEGTLIGKYAQASASLAGKYAQKPKPTAPVTGETLAAGSTPAGAGAAAPAPRVDSRDAEDHTADAAPAAAPARTASLVGKYARKES